MSVGGEEDSISSSLYSNINDSGMLISTFGGLEKYTALLKLLQCFKRGFVKIALSSVMAEQSFSPTFLVKNSAIISSDSVKWRYMVSHLWVIIDIVCRLGIQSRNPKCNTFGQSNQSVGFANVISRDQVTDYTIKHSFSWKRTPARSPQVGGLWVSKYSISDK